MKKLNKLSILLISSIFIFAVAVGISIFAYFSVTSNQAVSATTEIATENVVNITSYDDLFNNSKSGNYNDSKEVFDSESRKILRLTNSIELKADLIITNDIHLDLNNKKLNLNDKTLTFKHGYCGCFSIYGGTIEKGSSGLGKIDIDLPNASFITTGVTYQSNNNASNQDACLNIINIDPKYSAYSALYLVGNVIDSSLNDRVEFKNYETVSVESFALTQDKFITTKNKCILNSNTSEACSYIYKDIDLPTHYLSTDIMIEYSLDDDTYIDEYGKYTAPTTSADATLTATISHENWDSNYSCDFKLHLVNLNNQTVKDNVGLQLIKDYISEYYVENTLRVDENRSITNYYGFPNAIELPTSALGGNIEYSYSMTDYNNLTVSTTSHENNEVYVLEPNSDCFHLVVNLNGNQNVSLNMHSNYVSDYETIARLIINKLYGGSITVDSSVNSKTLYTLNNMINGIDSVDILDATTKSYISTYNITSVTYTLKTGSDAVDFYTLSDYLLVVKSNASPDIKSEALTMTFKFGSGADAVDIPIDLYIAYMSDGGNTLSGFLPYYTEFNAQVQDELITEFEMPFYYGGAAPYVCYDIAYNYGDTINYTSTKMTQYIPNFDAYNVTLGIPDCLDIILYYNGAEQYTFTKGQTTSLTSELATYFSAAAQSNDAKYIFRLNAQGAFASNCNILLIYNYKFKASDSWRRYEYAVKDDQNVSHTYLTELTTTPFTVSGGLFYNATSTKSNAIHDTTFFKWIYNNFNTTENAEELTTVTSNSFIPVGWLSQDISIDITADSTLNGVTDFYGIGNLKNVKKVNLSGKTLSSAVLTSLTGLENATTLILNNCGIENVSAISTLITVRELEIANNNISYFDDLIKMTNLFSVVLYGNKPTNAIIGSKGICNFQTYYDLIKNGVSIYNQVSTYVDESNVSHEIAVLFADSDDYNDYVRLKALITQNKLSKNVSITKLYTGTLDKITISNIELKYNTGSLTWGYEGDGSTYEGTATKYVKSRVTIGASVTAGAYYELVDGTYTLTEDTTFLATKTYYEVATEFNATYCYVVHTWDSYTLVCKFYVDRY